MLPRSIMWLLPHLFLSLIHIPPTTVATTNSALLLLPAQNLTHIPPGSLTSAIEPAPPPLPDIHYAHCHRIIEPPMPGLHPTNCGLAAQLLCREIDRSSRSAVLDRWVWNELVGCATGYFVPGRFFYQELRCEGAFEAIIEACATDSRFNAGSENVEVLPNFTQPAEAWVRSRPMYVMAPKKLTL